MIQILPTKMKNGKEYLTLEGINDIWGRDRNDKDLLRLVLKQVIKPQETEDGSSVDVDGVNCKKPLFNESILIKSLNKLPFELANKFNTGSLLAILKQKQIAVVTSKFDPKVIQKALDAYIKAEKYEEQIIEQRFILGGIISNEQNKSPFGSKTTWSKDFANAMSAQSGRKIHMQRLYAAKKIYNAFDGQISRIKELVKHFENITWDFLDKNIKIIQDNKDDLDNMVEALKVKKLLGGTPRTLSENRVFHVDQLANAMPFLGIPASTLFKATKTGELVTQATVTENNVITWITEKPQNISFVIRKRDLGFLQKITQPNIYSKILKEAKLKGVSHTRAKEMFANSIVKHPERLHELINIKELRFQLNSFISKKKNQTMLGENDEVGFTITNPILEP